jgi:hypothetical protein
LVDATSGTLTLTGTAAASGVVSLVGSTIKSTSPETLDNLNNTIVGAGTIGAGDGKLMLKNESGGTIDATGTLTLKTGNTITVPGFFEAMAGARSTCATRLINSTGTGALGISICQFELPRVDVRAAAARCSSPAPAPVASMAAGGDRRQQYQ